ncbi:MAG: hypothetical protein ACLS95_03460 [Clostridia bacterium]|jgi:predicted permease
MNIFIILAIVIANAIALAFIYQFVKKMPKKDKLIFIAASFAMNYMLILIVYALSGIGMDAAIHSSAETFITYVFVPVNIILFVPFLAHSYMKMKEKRLKPETFIKRTAVLLVVFLVVLVLEFFYFRNIQNNIGKMNQEQLKQTEQNVQTNTVITNEVDSETQNQITNMTKENITNQISNTILQNTITNTQKD